MLHYPYNNGAGKSRSPILMIEGQEEFELEKVLTHRPLHKSQGDSGISHLVKWVGYGPAYNSCCLAQTRAPQTLADYWDEVAAVQATESGMDADTGWPLVLTKAMLLQAEVEIEAKGEVEANQVEVLSNRLARR